MTTPFLIRVCEALATRNVRYAIVGGHAVALHGAVRGTIDVDVALKWSRSSLVRAEKALADLGLVSQLPLTADDVFQYRDEYVRNRNLIAWSFCHPQDPSEQVDLIVNYDLTGRKLRKIDVGSIRVSVLNKSDLIEMKQASGRPQDLEDVAALERLP